ncbi:glycosyltransferase family 2 protein [Terrimonas sp. NA20]|uniref:Glycosyltransferase family 2 protein n=1 Tax=Terrimonas ginsenosidimutans TaxID=2908004 RepID=A0ABS9L0I5_9BACT|nr:glycosyltransferase family 2 protein [Terrimonas ginsenosidimutans]MCG2618083.1 glycosyltransferase family 2 protein [Terrimonas ginsenosidimutans]
MLSPLDLTIAIPVKNEQTNLAGCLAAIGSGLARKIVVIDSGSTDETIKIAVDNGAEVIPFEWNGKFPKKRNWFLRNHRPETEWVLFLDADEYLTEEFKKTLRVALDDNNVSGYWLSYSIYFLGRKLKGGYPLRKLALFRVSSGEYERIDEERWSHLDMEIHEHPVLNGKTQKLKTQIDHRDFRGIQHYMHKHNEYASWEAARFLKLKNDQTAWNSLTWKQKMKYRLMNTPFIGPVYFLGSYIFMGGFLDGARGFSFAIFKMSYFTEVYCKIQEIQKHK